LCCCVVEKMRRWEGVKMRRCEDEKMRRWETDLHYWKNPALRRSREKESLIEEGMHRQSEIPLAHWRYELWIFTCFIWTKGSPPCDLCPQVSPLVHFRTQCSPSWCSNTQPFLQLGQNTGNRVACFYCPTSLKINIKFLILNFIAIGHGHVLPRLHLIVMKIIGGLTSASARADADAMSQYLDPK
jgi:hypothetical protein